MKKPLSAREQEVLDLVKKNQGLTAREIGAKAKPPLKPNGLYMTVNRIKQKGYNVDLKKGKGGRRKSTTPPPKRTPAPEPPSNPHQISGGELIDSIKARLADDIAAIDKTMKGNEDAKVQAEKLVARLIRENAELSTTKERIEAIKM